MTIYWLHTDEGRITVDARFASVDAFSDRLSDGEIVPMDQVWSEADEDGRLVCVGRKRIAVSLDHVRKIEEPLLPDPVPLPAGVEIVT